MYSALKAGLLSTALRICALDLPTLVKADHSYCGPRAQPCSASAITHVGDTSRIISAGANRITSSRFVDQFVADIALGITLCRLVGVCHRGWEGGGRGAGLAQSLVTFTNIQPHFAEPHGELDEV